jgi:hypothetical protein
LCLNDFRVFFQVQTHSHYFGSANSIAVVSSCLFLGKGCVCRRELLFRGQIARNGYSDSNTAWIYNWLVCVCLESCSLGAVAKIICTGSRTLCHSWKHCLQVQPSLNLQR